MFSNSKLCKNDIIYFEQNEVEVNVGLEIWNERNIIVRYYFTEYDYRAAFVTKGYIVINRLYCNGIGGSTPTINIDRITVLFNVRFFRDRFKYKNDTQVHKSIRFKSIFNS